MVSLFPDELNVEIFRYLPANDLISCLRVDRYFRRFALDRSFVAKMRRAFEQGVWNLKGIRWYLAFHRVEEVDVRELLNQRNGPFPDLSALRELVIVQPIKRGSGTSAMYRRIDPYEFPSDEITAAIDYYWRVRDIEEEDLILELLDKIPDLYLYKSIEVMIRSNVVGTRKVTKFLRRFRFGKEIVNFTMRYLKAETKPEIIKGFTDYMVVAPKNVTFLRKRGVQI